MAQAMSGLSLEESTAVATDLIARIDLPLTRVLKGLGRYAEAESLL